MKTDSSIITRSIASLEEHTPPEGVSWVSERHWPGQPQAEGKLFRRTSLYPLSAGYQLGADALSGVSSRLSGIHSSASDTLHSYVIEPLRRQWKVSQARQRSRAADKLAAQELEEAHIIAELEESLKKIKDSSAKGPLVSQQRGQALMKVVDRLSAGL